MSRADGDRADIEYQVPGQGRPAVLLHRFPDSGRLWRHQVPALVATEFQVIVAGLRGGVRQRRRAAARVTDLS